MKKYYCDKCGNEINLQHCSELTKILGTNGGSFQYHLEYSFDGGLALHGMKQSDEFDKSLDLCTICAIKLIELIENVNLFSEELQC